MSADLADLLVESTRALAAARYERDAYKGWFKAALDSLRDQHDELEQTRRQNAALRDEIRSLTRRDLAA